MDASRKTTKTKGLAALRAHIPAENMEAHAQLNRLVREQARRETRALTPSKVEDYLLDTVRAQHAGLDFVELCQTLSKTVFTGDTAGKRVGEHWTGVALKAIRECATPEEAAAKIASDVESHNRGRDTSRRLTLALGLTELQIRHAEALDEDPLTYVRPIRVTGEVEPALSLSYGGLLGDAGEQDGAVSE